VGLLRWPESAEVRKFLHLDEALRGEECAVKHADSIQSGAKHFQEQGSAAGSSGHHPRQPAIDGSPRQMAQYEKLAQLRNDTRQSGATPQPVVQLVNSVHKAINGLTHLVEMTGDGHIYNENFLENERAEVKFGDRLVVDLDDAVYSRRGIHQEDNAKTDKTGEPRHLWVRVISLNDDPVGPGIYVRHEMLKGPIKIVLPRDRRGVDQVLNDTKGAFDRVAKGTHSSVIAIRGALLGINRRLHSASADSQVNLDVIGQSIRTEGSKVDKLLDEKLISPDEYNQVSAAIQRLIEEFNLYKRPKREHALGGRIGAADLRRMGMVGLDLGGIGIRPNYLDVNVDDSTLNNANALVIGDAMNLQASFEPNCTNNVVADLLPLVLMVGEDSVPARIQAMRAVLQGADYVTGRAGTVRIQFNDNSGDAEVQEEQLRKLAEECGYNIERESVVRWRKFSFYR
jgi:hypothetical protein